MKTTIVEEQHNEPIQFPCIMVHENQSTIILATGYDEYKDYKGIALKCENEKYLLKLAEHWSSKVFKPLKGDLILSND